LPGPGEASPGPGDAGRTLIALPLAMRSGAPASETRVRKHTIGRFEQVCGRFLAVWVLMSNSDAALCCFRDNARFPRDRDPVRQGAEVSHA
jgi:hypothetical protein